MILTVFKCISQSCIGTSVMLGKRELGCTLGWRNKECSLVNTRKYPRLPDWRESPPSGTSFHRSTRLQLDRIISGVNCDLTAALGCDDVLTLKQWRWR